MRKEGFHKAGRKGDSLLYRCKQCGGPMLYDAIVTDTTNHFMGFRHKCINCGWIDI